MIQTQENDQTPHFGPDLCPLGPNSGPQFFFFFLNQGLEIVPNYHSMQFTGKLMNKTRENGE